MPVLPSDLLSSGVISSANAQRKLVDLFQKYYTRSTDTPFPEKQIRRDRAEIAHFLLALETRDLIACDGPEARATFFFIAGMQIAQTALTQTELAFTDRLRYSILENPALIDSAALLALSLYRPLWLALPALPTLTTAPSALLPWLVEVCSLPPVYFPEPGLVEIYVDFSDALQEMLLQQLAESPVSTHITLALTRWVGVASGLQTYFSTRNLRSYFARRGRLVQHFLLLNVPALVKEVQNPSLASEAVGSKHSLAIRVGIYIETLIERPETFFTLAHYEWLPRPEFTIILFSHDSDPISPFSVRLLAAADQHVTLLPQLDVAANQIRTQGLDFLLFGTNLTATVNKMAVWLAGLRLAPVQIATMCSPTTSGLPMIDAYLSAETIQSAAPGTDPILSPAPQESYTEALWLLPGSIKQFALPEEVRTPPAISRVDLGIGSDTVLLISGANYFKIIPELSECWIEILRQAPEAHLALFPFNPNWSSSYQLVPFQDRIRQQAKAASVPEGQISLLKPLPHAGDIRAYLALADLYLDSYPFSGAASIYDPLALGLPVLAWEGSEARSRQCASMLRNIQFEELISTDYDSYIALTLALIRDPDRRRSLSTRIHQRMQIEDPLNKGRDLEKRLAVLLREKKR